MRALSNVKVRRSALEWRGILRRFENDRVPMTDPLRRDLLEILEDRYRRRSTLVTSQLPVDAWHDYLGDPTLADAILGRLVHNAHRITLKGRSMRKRTAALTADDQKQ